MSEPEYDGQKEFDEDELLPVYREDKDCPECNSNSVWKISNTNASPTGQGSQFECTECGQIWNTGSLGF